ncbi:MAG: DUF4365 domain-containing protein [Acidobacteria bacterium]|nr:DUF4365 domain-containing protein [Acidobacteriota bacterium]
MKGGETSFLGIRAEQLAIVYLTRRNDLVVKMEGPGFFPDLLVSLSKEGNYTGRMFGVIVKAEIQHKPDQPWTTKQATSFLQEEETKQLLDIPFPVCLFVFRMDTDEGFYKWVRKPVFSEDGSPQLIIDQTTPLEKLDNDSMNRMVQEINHWYEARVKIPA